MRGVKRLHIFVAHAELQPAVQTPVSSLQKICSRLHIQTTNARPLFNRYCVPKRQAACMPKTANSKVECSFASITCWCSSVSSSGSEQLRLSYICVMCFMKYFLVLQGKKQQQCSCTCPAAYHNHSSQSKIPNYFTDISLKYIVENPSIVHQQGKKEAGDLSLPNC